MKLINIKFKPLIEERIESWNKHGENLEKIESFKKISTDITDIKKTIKLNGLTKLRSLEKNIDNQISLIEKELQSSNSCKTAIENINTKHIEIVSSLKEKNNKVKGLEKKINYCKYSIFIIVPAIFLLGYLNIKKKLNETIKSLENEIIVLNENKKKLLERLKLYADTINKSVKKIDELTKLHYDNIFIQHSKETENILKRDETIRYYEWDENLWSEWESSNRKIASELCIGKFTETKEDYNFSLPATIPFMGSGKCILIHGNRDDDSKIKSLFESMITRIALMFPHRVEFTFIDTVALGSTFSNISKRITLSNRKGSTYKILESIQKDVERIISTYGLSELKTFIDISDITLVNEKYENIFIADFPINYERREIELLQKIANICHIAGKQIFIHYNSDIEFPHELKIEDFKNRYKIDFNELKQYGNTVCKFKLIPDQKPPENLINKLFEKLKLTEPPIRKIEWNEENPLTWEKWWQESSKDNIGSPIGKSGHSEKLDIWFGTKSYKGVEICSHGILLGMTGSGKSNLFHTFILGLSIRYSPIELSLYLIDGKNSAEFEIYKKLPQAKFVSTRSQSKLSRGILSELLEEKKRRKKLFSEKMVHDYSSFREDNPNEHLPRIVLIVDEYQDLFDRDREIVSDALLQLTQQGRNVGIHLLLSSQSFEVPGILHLSAIMANINLKIGLNMSQSTRESLNEFGKEAKILLKNCDTPGKVVINKKSGDDGGNQIGKIYTVSHDEKEKVIDKLIEKAHTNNLPLHIIKTHTFDGIEEADFSKNRQITNLIKLNSWPNAKELQKLTQKDENFGGLDAPNWFKDEKPAIGWLGKEFNVRGLARVIVRRKQRENLIFVGDNNEARYGMLLSLITSFVLNSTPSKNQFYIMDFSIKDSPWNEALEYIVQELLTPLGIMVKRITSQNELEEFVSELETEFHRRNYKNNADLHYPNTYIIGADIDRCDKLCQFQNNFGVLEKEALGLRLQKLLINGASKGIHSILSFESVMAMQNIISKKNLGYFRHRIALQMYEFDSFTFIKKIDASQLEDDNGEAVSAIYWDLSNNNNSQFKPYCLNNNLKQTIKHIFKKIKHR